MHNPTIVVLTGFRDIFDRFMAATDYYEPDAQKIVVTSGQCSQMKPCWCGHEKQRHMRTSIPGRLHRTRCLTPGCLCLEFQENPATIYGKWHIIEGPEPFNFARNANIAIKACAGDVLLVNDDVEFLRSFTLQTLRSVAHRFCNQRTGILSPQISGIVGNRLQIYGTPLDRAWGISEERLCFVCVYIRREVFDSIGYLDESFTGYGQEDSDFCLRAQQAGFRLEVTDQVVVKHGFAGLGCSSSFLRAMTVEQYRAATEAANQHFAEKWHLRAAESGVE